MIKWLKEVISDERGYQSSKRVIAMVGALSLCLTLIVDWFFNVSVSDGVVSAVMTIICIGLGTSTIDKFSLKNEK